MILIYLKFTGIYRLKNLHVHSCFIYIYISLSDYKCAIEIYTYIYIYICVMCVSRSIYICTCTQTHILVKGLISFFLLGILGVDVTATNFRKEYGAECFL